MPTYNCIFNPVEVAVKAAGGRLNLAKSLNPPVTRQAVEGWIKRGEIPPRRVPEVSAITGIPKHVLSPLFVESEKARGTKKCKTQN